MYCTGSREGGGGCDPFGPELSRCSLSPPAVLDFDPVTVNFADFIGVAIFQSDSSPCNRMFPLPVFEAACFGFLL